MQCTFSTFTVTPLLFHLYEDWFLGQFWNNCLTYMFNCAEIVSAASSIFLLKKLTSLRGWQSFHLYRTIRIIERIIKINTRKEFSQRHGVHCHPVSVDDIIDTNADCLRV